MVLSLDDSTVFFTRDNPVHTRCEHANNHTTELVLSMTSYANCTVKLFPIPVKVYIYKIPTAKVLPRHKNVQKLSNLLVLKKQKCYAVLKTHQAKKKWFWRLLINQVLQVQTKIEPRSLRGVLDTTLCDSMLSTCNRSMVFSGYSSFHYQYKWPPRYNWNIVESGVKYHTLTLTQTNII